MLISTKIYIVLALLIALVVSFLFYNKNTATSKLVKNTLFLLRALALFLVFLLFINPKITNKTTEIIKPNLIVLSDNSASLKVNKSGTELESFKNAIKNNKALNEKYNIKDFLFSNDLSEYDTLSFKDKATNISNALFSVEKLHKKEQNAIVLLTDGIQTNGLEYEYIQTKSNLFPVVFGDTTLYEDVSISQLNVNKYAYLKHKFPVEVFVNYKGKANRNLSFKVLNNKQTIFNKSISLSKINNSERISFHLPANMVGFTNYKAIISSFSNEKNIKNNAHNFSVEVIDEQAKIAIVSSIKHPDIGALKRVISTNKQRKVEIIHPTKFVNSRDYALVILYQPNQSFDEVFKEIKQNNSNVLIVTGKQTNWSYLNSAQDYFSKNAINKTESYFGSLNNSFTTFHVDEIGFNEFPPLVDYYGDVTFNYEVETILNQSINKIETKQPLVGVINKDSQKIGFVFGEGIFKWNMSSFVHNNSKENFNEFVNSMVQYLSLTKKDNLLEVEAKPFYYASDMKNIYATYYDANYNASTKEELWIEVKNKSTKEKLKYPMIVGANKYKIALNNLIQGDYIATVFNEKNNNKKAINFTVLPYSLEEQIVRSNVEKMQLLAQTNKSKLYFSSQIKELEKSLLKNNDLKNIQKEKVTKKPLIQLYWILSLLIFILALEWFIRKYNGLT